MGEELSRSVSRGNMESSALKAVGVWFRSLDTGRYLYLLRNILVHGACLAVKLKLAKHYWAAWNASVLKSWVSFLRIYD
jgi:hypothetical protein